MQNELEKNTTLEHVRDARTHLLEALHDIPQFKAILYRCLLDEWRKLDPNASLERRFVNILTGARPSSSEPVGNMLDVFFECFKRGNPPKYTADKYGMYELAGVDNENFRLKYLDVTKVGNVIVELMQKLPEKCSFTLSRYWDDSSVVDSRGRSLPSPKQALRTLQAKLFWRELDMAANENLIPKGNVATINGLIGSGLPSSCYAVSVEKQQGGFSTLASTFVISLSGAVGNELNPAGSQEVVLYSPFGGIEKFSTASALHQALQQRMSNASTRTEFLQVLPEEERALISSAPAIRYARILEDLFEHCNDGLLAMQSRDFIYQVRKLQSAGAHTEAAWVPLDTVLSMATLVRSENARNVFLIKAMQKNARPEWFKKAYVTNQELYVGLEKNLLESQIQLHELTKDVASLAAYARQAVEDFISPGTDERINPDTVFVNINHSVRMADGKRIELSERKTLTQAFMYGVHDRAGRYTITLDKNYGIARLTPENIARAIETLELRLAYGPARQRVYGQQNVKEAMREVLGRKTAMTLFSAILQKHITSTAQDIVQRYNFGDPSIEASGIALRSFYNFKPLKDLIVYRRKGGEMNRKAYVLYAPGSAMDKDWYEFSDLDSLQRTIGLWALEEKGRAYLQSQVHDSDRHNLEHEVFRKEWPRGEPTERIQGRAWWDQVNLVAWADSDGLKGSIQSLLAWEEAEEKVVTPNWYRNAPVADRHLFNRLNTDFKAIYDASKEKLHIEGFQKFAHDLVMSRLNESLGRTGDRRIDPDQVMVKFHKGAMTLTQLFINWHLWRSDNSVFEKILVPGSNTYRDNIRVSEFWWKDTGKPMTELTSNTLNKLVDLMPGEHYSHYLKSQFLWYPDDLRVNLYRELKKNEMFRAALTQKLNGSLPQLQYEWLVQSIKGLDRDTMTPPGISPGSEPGEGVYEFWLEGARIAGGYVFGERHVKYAYIPNSPGGNAFVWVGDLSKAIENDRLLGEHLRNLAGLRGQDRIGKYISKSRDPRGSLPIPNLGGAHPVYNFKAEYESMIGRSLDDLDVLTTTPAESFWQETKILLEVALDVVSIFVPPVGFAVSVLKISHSIVQGIIASSQGDSAGANAHFASAWRGAIVMYLGKVAAVGSAASAFGLLSSIRDLSDVLSAVTGVPVGISYVTAVAVPHWTPVSSTRVVG
ncbi:dermonecrotic toxin domain-containing protein [Pseudomonas sp. RT6P73]